jgi:hypothetical protein
LPRRPKRPGRFGSARCCVTAGARSSARWESEQVKRLKDLETENTRLRRAVSDLILEELILQEVARGNYGCGARPALDFDLPDVWTRACTRSRGCPAMPTLSVRAVRVNGRPAGRPQGLGFRHRARSYRDRSRLGHRGAARAATGATFTGRAYRRRTAGILRAQRSQCPFGLVLPESPRTRRGVCCAGAVVVPYRGLPQLRDRAHRRRR